MKYRKLGANGPTVSAIGLGAGSATTHFGERDDDVQIATVHRAIDLGVTLFDTADRYMQGRHERMLGRALDRPPRQGRRLLQVRQHRQARRHQGLQRPPRVRALGLRGEP